MGAMPPRFARFLMRRLLPRDAREFVVGDLDEEFRRFDFPRDDFHARRWYWSQAIRSIAHSMGRAPTGPTLQHPVRSRPRGGALMTALLQDVRFTLRNLKRTPGFTFTVLMTLGLGIGATTAIFSAVNEVMLRPLPFAEPDRLVMLWVANQERGWDRVHAAPANVLDWRERVAAFEDVAFVNDFTSGVALASDDEPTQVILSNVSGNAFSMLGVPPLLGRTFTEDETWSEDLLVLSHDAWQRYFSGDPEIVGRTIRLDGNGYQVIGVMGAEFRYGINDAEMWTTFSWMAPRRESVWFRQAHVVRAIARLRPGVTYAQARSELSAVAAQLEQEHPQLNRAMEAGLTPLRHFIVGDRRLSLFLLLGAVMMLQVIVCANVANLFLARSVGRRHEIAVRAALGASRGRIVRQVLTESVVVALAGTAVGLAIGVVGLRWISSLSPPELGVLAFRLDWRLIVFTGSVCGVSALLFGTFPALRSSRVQAVERLREGSRTGTAGRRRSLAANSLVSVEIGLAVMLVVGAGLMIRSLAQLRGIDPGVDTVNVLTFQIQPPSGSYSTDRARADFVIRLLDRLRGIPGVREVGAVRKLPYTGFGWTSDFSIEGWGPDEFGIDVRHREASPGYFRAMGIPVLAGRLFDLDIAPDEAVPVVVNQAFVQRYFPDESPVGRRIAFDRNPSENSYWYPIVGVVGNERMSIASDPLPEIIAHLRGDMPATVRFALKTAVPPLSIVQAVRTTLAELDAEIPLVRIRTMDEVAADARASDRFLMTLLGIFGAAALVIAAVGVYGVTAQAARSRTREIGIRMALGASERSVVRYLVFRSVSSLAAGLVLGVVGVVTGGRAIGSLLYGVEPTDPVTVIGVVGLMALTALASSYWPAWRATKLDPVRVLRSE